MKEETEKEVITGGSETVSNTAKAVPCFLSHRRCHLGRRVCHGPPGAPGHGGRRKAIE